jgi:hypothetical protein
MSIPNFSNAPGPTRAALYAAWVRRGPWSIISSRPAKAFGGEDTGNTSAWCRTEVVSPIACVAVKSVYGGFWGIVSGQGEAGLYNDVRLQVAFRKQGISINRGLLDPAFFASFRGSYIALLQSGQRLETDAVYMPVAANERFFCETYEDNNVGAGPSAPVCTPTSGTGLSTGTYYITVCYMWVGGGRSLPSAQTAVTLTTGLGVILVTAPAAVPGAGAYRVYYSTSNGGAGTLAPNYQDVPLGTNFSLNSLATTSDGTNSQPQMMLDITRPGNSGLYYTTGGTGGGVGSGDDNNGEAYIAGRNYIQAIASQAVQGQANGIAPMLTLGIPADGQYHPSAMCIGDSIGAGTGDNGYSYQQGGFFARAFGGHAGLYYLATDRGLIGWGTLCEGGETELQAANVNNFHKRWEYLGYATSVVDEYCLNDIYNAVTGAAGWYVNAQTVYNLCASLGLWYYRTTCIPSVVSTDGYQTTTNQSIPLAGHTVAMEGLRRMCNNLMRDTSGSVAVTADIPFRAQATATPSTNFYSGGDGTTQAYYFTYPALVSSIVANVNGTPTAAYTTIGAVTVNGAIYCDGISFTSAPGNGLSVTANYTKLASCAPGFGPFFAGVFDTAAQIEVNASNALTPNGGWLIHSTASPVVTSQFTSVTNSSTVNDTNQNFTTDQYRAYQIYLTSGTGAGQWANIFWMAPTQFRVGPAFGVLPDATTHYIIYQGANCGDNVHPSSWGHQMMATAVNPALIK